MSSEIEHSRTPSLSELFAASMGQVLDNLFVAMPGIVVSYDSRTGTADIRPALKKPFVNADGSESTDDLPILPKVPVMQPRGSKFFMHIPLEKNDNVLLVICDNSITEYLLSSGSSQIDPIDLRTHDISDAVAIPGFFTFKRALKDSIGSGITLGKEKGAQIRVKDSDVEITSNGLESSVGGYVAMAMLCDYLWTTLDTIFRTAWVPVPQDGGAALKTAYLAAFVTPPSSVASKNLKAD